MCFAKGVGFVCAVLPVRALVQVVLKRVRTKNLKISTRLSGAFALLVLMLVGLAVAAMAQLSSMRAATVEISENWLPSIGGGERY